VNHDRRAASRWIEIRATPSVSNPAAPLTLY
jgi:hypothetical protein